MLCKALEATRDAFDVLHYLASKRLSRGLLTVVDATNVRAEDRKPLVQLAREFHCLPVTIVVDTPERVCHERNASRPDRNFGPHVIRNQKIALRQGLRTLEREGFRHVFVLRSAEECERATLVREPLWNNLKHEAGPFDIVGDVHGCYDELVALLGELGHVISQLAGEPEGVCDMSFSDGTGTPRKIVFVGDLVDRGPKTPAVLRLVMKLVAEGKALCVPGNHDIKLLRALRGKNVQITHGLAESLAQLAGETPEFRASIATFIDDLVSHYMLDGGRLVVATPWNLVDLSSQASEDATTQWWTELTTRGGEGMVVKPKDFIARGPRGTLQPAIKVRGREYLRIIYGPEYTLPETLDRLRSRALGSKRSLAMKELALGIEALERFVRREPLRRVQECAFAVLAMESEPVDPRL